MDLRDLVQKEEKGRRREESKLYEVERNFRSTRQKKDSLQGNRRNLANAQGQKVKKISDLQFVIPSGHSPITVLSSLTLD